MAEWQHALIVGASSGIGQAVAVALAGAGTQVALVARREDALEQVATAINAAGQGTARTYQHDVQDLAAIPGLFQQIAHDLGGLDLVIYAAGIMPHVGADEYPTTTDAQIIAINLVGAIGWLNEAAARFAALGNGTIVGIASVAADRGRRGAPVYNTSKAALTTYLEALRNRLTVRGVTVVTIKPGYVATSLLAGQQLPKFLPVITPERCAQAILDVAHHKRTVAYIPAVWGPIMWLVRAIPSPIFSKLNF